MVVELRKGSAHALQHRAPGADGAVGSLSSSFFFFNLIEISMEPN